MRHWLLAVVAATAIFLLASETMLAATITVNTAVDDHEDNGSICSLREAILAANLNVDVNGCLAGTPAPTVDVIRFSIGSGPQSLLIDTTTLADIVEPVTIDGTTQPGFNGSPIIEVRRGTAPEGRGLTLKSTASNSTIRGLALNNWTPTQNIAGRALTIDGASNCVIEGNWFGIRLDASIDRQRHGHRDQERRKIESDRRNHRERPQRHRSRRPRHTQRDRYHGRGNRRQRRAGQLHPRRSDRDRLSGPQHHYGPDRPGRQEHHHWRSAPGQAT